MTFNWSTFLLEIVNFAVLAFVLHRLLYRPLSEAIDKRREMIARAQEDADKASREAEALKQQLRAQLDEAEQMRQSTLHQARQQAEVERQKLLAEAEQAIERHQADSEQALAHQREDALKALSQEVISQAVALAGRLLTQASERTLHQQLALRLIQTLEQLPEAEKRQMRSSWQPSDNVVVECAQELDAATLEHFQRVVSDLVSQPVALAVQNRPELLGGVRLRLDGHVWDGSITGQIPSGDFSLQPNGNS